VRTVRLAVRITRTQKCREGFYLLVNGSRTRHSNKAKALDALKAILSMQRIQILTVREFAARQKHRQKVSTPPGAVVGGSAWQKSSMAAWTRWPRSGPASAPTIEQLELWPQLSAGIN